MDNIKWNYFYFLLYFFRAINRYIFQGNRTCLSTSKRLWNHSFWQSWLWLFYFKFFHFLGVLEPTSISAWVITVLSNHSINSFLTCTPNYLIWTSSYELFQLKLKDLIEIFLLCVFLLMMNGHLTSAVQRRYSENVFSPVVSGKKTNF